MGRNLKSHLDSNRWLILTALPARLVSKSVDHCLPRVRPVSSSSLASRRNQGFTTLVENGGAVTRNPLPPKEIATYGNQ